MMKQHIKSLAWSSCGWLTRLGRGLAGLMGRRRKVDVLIYKVDRLGDWFMVEPTIRMIVATAQARGETVAIWTSKEIRPLLSWRSPGCTVEQLTFEPKQRVAKLRRTLSLMRLVATYKADKLICLRHAPDPIRDFVLSQADVRERRALSWLIYPGVAAEVPHEIRRHHAILTSSGLAPANIRDLFPLLPRNQSPSAQRVVLAPFSSARIKDWSDSSWQEVIQALGHQGLGFELWVGPDQIERADKLAVLLRSSRANILISVKSGSIPELAAAVTEATMVLAVDTFAAHLAVAADVPAVCLIGGGQFGDFGPWQRSARQQWISVPLPCHGCNWQCTRTQPDCMLDITPSRVLRAIEAVMKAGGHTDSAAGRNSSTLTVNG